MTKKMTIRGIGHLFEYFIIPAGFLFIASGFIFKNLFSFRIHYPILLAAGIISLSAGLFLNFISMKKIIPAFKAGNLVKDGIFKFSRNPTYASLILFTIPSIAFFFDNFLVLLCSMLAYIIFRININKEEIFLEEKFGEEYRTYRNKVGQLFPKINPFK